MKSITIPSNYDPFIVNINGIVYSYKAGTTQSVPDEVADLIDNINRAEPRHADRVGVVGQVWTRTADGAEWKDIVPYVLPAASATAIGGVKIGAAVANATDATDVITQLNALIASLVASGALTEYVEPTVEA